MKSISELADLLHRIRDRLPDSARWSLERSSAPGYGSDSAVESVVLIRDGMLPRIELTWLSEWELRLSAAVGPGESIEEELYPHADAADVPLIVTALAEGKYEVTDGVIILKPGPVTYRFGLWRA